MLHSADNTAKGVERNGEGMGEGWKKAEGRAGGEVYLGKGIPVVL